MFRVSLYGTASALLWPHARYISEFSPIIFYLEVVLISGRSDRDLNEMMVRKNSLAGGLRGKETGKQLLILS